MLIMRGKNVKIALLESYLNEQNFIESVCNSSEKLKSAQSNLI